MCMDNVDKKKPIHTYVQIYNYIYDYMYVCVLYQEIHMYVHK